MAEGMRQVSIRQGHDPRDFALVPLGGAGPVPGIPLAEELSIEKPLSYPAIPAFCQRKVYLWHH
ncbi:MAG: hypothetical protein CM1200mP41_20910 [Gammaproteobacteria bacterium]|nr:MAG: hypothetical protein CM1200mP41_20910 [Gammaproteobacteria bacterium]